MRGGVARGRSGRDWRTKELVIRRPVAEAKRAARVDGPRAHAPRLSSALFGARPRHDLRAVRPARPVCECRGRVVPAPHPRAGHDDRGHRHARLLAMAEASGGRGQLDAPLEELPSQLRDWKLFDD